MSDVESSAPARQLGTAPESIDGAAATETELADTIAAEMEQDTLVFLCMVVCLNPSLIKIIIKILSINTVLDNVLLF